MKLFLVLTTDIESGVSGCDTGFLVFSFVKALYNKLVYVYEDFFTVTFKFVKLFSVGLS